MKASPLLLSLLIISLSQNVWAQVPAVPATATPPAIAPTEQTATESAAAAASATSPSQSRINEALAKIPHEKAVIFDNTMRKNQENNREKQQELRSLYTDIRNNFVGVTFNKEEFIAQSLKARELQVILRANLDKDLADIASKFTQDERQIIFNALPARYTRE